MTSLPAPLRRLLDLSAGFTGVLNALQPVAALAARLYVAQVFFLSGLTKLRDWGTTVALLHYHCGVRTLRTRQMMMDIQSL